MGSTNMALLRGTITAEPLVRPLPSGGTVTQLELTTRVDGRAVSVPVALHDRDSPVGEGDEAVVTGYVNRRFFRAGGVTQARTEVIAFDVIKATRRKAVERAIAQMAAKIEGFS